MKSIKQIKPDIMHSFTPKAGLICAIAGYLCHTRFRIHTFTGLIFPYRKLLFKQILIYVDKLICKLNTHIIAEGEGVKRQLIDANIITENIHIIGNGNIAGVDTDQYHLLNPEIKEKTKLLIKQLRIDSKSYYFIFIGRFNNEKGINELLWSFQNLGTNNVKLILVGDFERNDSFSKHVKKNYFSDENIYFVGWQSDIRPYLSISDCLILPSYREGFPNVVLQAGAMGIPSIVTNVTGSNEIITNDYNGWIVPPKNKIALVNQMRIVMNCSKNELKTIGRNARKNIKEKYEKTYYQKALVRFYDNLQID